MSERYRGTAEPLITLDETASQQLGDLRFLMYCQLDRLQSGAGDAQTELMLLAEDMSALAEESHNLVLAAIALSLAALLAKVGQTPTGFQMAEIRSILAGIKESDFSSSHGGTGEWAGFNHS